MIPISEQPLSDRGLAVLDITAPDEETLTAVMDGLQQRWATSGIATARHDPGRPGVRTRVYADIRRPGTDRSTGRSWLRS
ncbi:DUF6207 family protein [Streptomyces sp. NPDC051992]|uniref:DUF6207 family protein n=1 Tax=Streptomyces sp. NPDC051992 TaxID=3161012 RepID=UPI003422657C